MHALADQLLASAALANDQARPIQRRQAGDMFLRFQPGWIFANQLRGLAADHEVNIAN